MFNTDEDTKEEGDKESKWMMGTTATHEIVTTKG